MNIVYFLFEKAIAQKTVFSIFSSNITKFQLFYFSVSYYYILVFILTYYYMMNIIKILFIYSLFYSCHQYSIYKNSKYLILHFVKNYYFDFIFLLQLYLILSILIKIPYLILILTSFLL